MARDTRYDKLARLIRRDFEYAQTFEIESISASGREILVDANREGWRVDNSKLAQYRPFNAITIDNDASSEIRVYLRDSHEYWVDVPAGGSATVDEEYVNYVEVSDETGTPLSAGEVVVSVAKVVDTRELRLLEMAGMLNIGGS